LSRETRRFAWALTAVAAVALGVRLTYIIVERRDFDPGGDALFYHLGANLLADGKGFISPLLYQLGREVPAAEHPPLYTLFLAAPSALGMTSVLTHLICSAVLGTGTVVVVGVLGREVAGARAGLIAAAIAAVYPNVWAPDGMLQAETAAMFLVTLAVLLGYGYLRRPSWKRLALVGLACGLAALTRSELVLLVPALVVPLAWATRALGVARVATWLAVGALVPLLVLAPWLAFNASRFEEPVLLSTNFYPLLASANCDSTYYGELQGYFDIECASEVYEREGITPAYDQSQEGLVFRRAAFDYIGDEVGRLPHVVGVRLRRLVNLYEPRRDIEIDTFVEGREMFIARWGFYGFYPVAGLAVAGAIVLRRRGATPLFPLLAPSIVVIVTVIVTYASTRFRAVAEPTLAVLAAIAIDAAIAWVARRRTRA
jgi:4-amino-4-deoxy-L-arabinose transferase-like glycosyltransferase